MANRFFTPNQQFADSTGLPYANGSLLFYSSGTSTPLATYSNRALTIANTNPVVLDSAGRAGDIFLQNLAYKVVLCSDAAGLVPVWTADPVYASDFSTTASFLSGAGSPNGNTAGSQGSPTVPASVYWDTTNNILYVCTTTGNAAGAVWTAVNASTAAAVVPAPQGYLTLTTGTPIIAADVISAVTVYYTPYVGNLIPIYNGSSFSPTVFTELSLAMNAAHVANNLYDVFVFNNSGVPTVVTGPSWAAGTGGNITAGSCARGTGAGGAALTRVNGIWTNTVQITGRNGATTYIINANLATYVGSIFVDGTNGQVSCHVSYGQSRKWGVWNAYNRVPIILQAGDSTASWNTAPATWRQSRADATNFAMAFCGLPEERYSAVFNQTVQQTISAGGGTCRVNTGIGINSTTVPTGDQGFMLTNVSVASITALYELNINASATSTPSLGINQYNMIEQAPTSSTANVLFGAAGFMVMTLAWRA